MNRYQTKILEIANEYECWGEVNFDKIKEIADILCEEKAAIPYSSYTIGIEIIYPTLERNKEFCKHRLEEAIFKMIENDFQLKREEIDFKEKEKEDPFAPIRSKLVAATEQIISAIESLNKEE